MKSFVSKYNLSVSNKYQLSPSLFKGWRTEGKNSYVSLRDLLSGELKRIDLGNEVGSINYVKDSNRYFIRTKALQVESVLPIISNETVEKINPFCFVDNNLKKDDIIISKDGNIGEVIILDKDYPDFMLSSALHRLSFKENKYYILAFLKHPYFKKQLYTLVPKGVTFRHAAFKYLECKIPFPSRKQDSKILQIENLMMLIIKLEKLILLKFQEMNNLILHELYNNQIQKHISLTQPKYSELKDSTRLDTGLYSYNFKRIHNLITNYKNGYFFITPTNIKSGKTPSQRYILKEKKLKYRWVTPSHCNDYGYLIFDEYIDMNIDNNLNQNSMLLINRTSRGGRGEYVGIAIFYNYDLYGKGHHNQGIYRVFNYSDTDLIFMSSFMNTSIMREYCSYLSVGSKMKEIKAKQFLKIPFPKFDNKLKEKISKLFFKNTNIGLNTEDFISNDKGLLNLGILNLGMFLKKSKNDINSIINNIINS